MQTRRMKSQNESIEEVSSISDNGKVFKIRVREKFREKKCKGHKCHSTMNLYRQFPQNRTIGKCSKLGVKLEIGGRLETY